MIVLRMKELVKTLTVSYDNMTAVIPQPVSDNRASSSPSIVSQTVSPERVGPQVPMTPSRSGLSTSGHSQRTPTVSRSGRTIRPYKFDDMNYY